GLAGFASSSTTSASSSRASSSGSRTTISSSSMTSTASSSTSSAASSSTTSTASSSTISPTSSSTTSTASSSTTTGGFRTRRNLCRHHGQPTTPLASSLTMPSFLWHFGHCMRIMPGQPPNISRSACWNQCAAPTTG